MTRSNAPAYMTGFGNHFATEAAPGALPEGQNSPQKTPMGLYAEQLSGTAFTAPRAENRRSWLYRLRPSAQHGPYVAFDQGRVRSGPFDETPPNPNRMRWDPLPIPETPTDWVEGLTTYGGNGEPDAGAGAGVHLYVANRSMTDRVFYDADGELLIVPQEGAHRFVTEMGVIEAQPGHVVLIPRGVRFRVEVEGPVRGYVCENYGSPFRLPDLGPIGANGLANPRDFETPVAAYEDVDRPTQCVQKYGGRLWATTFDHSPLDVVAWHGNLAPCRYDTARFNTINTVSYDHPDPSIFTVLTSPSETPGTANIDFVIFPPRWMVAEHTFRPPWFHRNVMSEFMGLVTGAYDAKAGGFAPGGASLHNRMSGHGPDQASYEGAIKAELKPHKIENTLAFMFETRAPIRVTKWASESPQMQLDYDDVWSGFTKGTGFMIRMSMIAAAALLAAACTPQTTTGAGSDAPMQSAEASACATRGGTMKQVGRLQSWQCVISYADAGKRCTDGAQCQGDCRVEGNMGMAAGTATAGVCQATSDRFGCHATVTDGKAGPTLCVD